MPPKKATEPRPALPPCAGCGRELPTPAGFTRSMTFEGASPEPIEDLCFCPTCWALRYVPR